MAGCDIICCKLKCRGQLSYWYSPCKQPLYNSLFKLQMQTSEIKLNCVHILKVNFKSYISIENVFQTENYFDNFSFILDQLPLKIIEQVQKVEHRCVRNFETLGMYLFLTGIFSVASEGLIVLELLGKVSLKQKKMV